MDVYTLSAAPAEALSALIAWGVADGRCPWLYGEAETGVTLARLAEADWRRWPHGRAFGQAVELAWWREGNGRYRLRLCLERGAPPDDLGLTWGTPESWLPRSADHEETLLHGSYDVDGSREIGQASWSEARIPRWLHYPLDVDGEAAGADQIRAVLLTRPYCQSDQRVGLTRLVGLNTWQPAEEAADGP